MLRHVEKVPRVSVKRLHEGRIDMDDSTRSKNSEQFFRSVMRIWEVFEYCLADHSAE
jgi:hypothetical protein